MKGIYEIDPEKWAEYFEYDLDDLKWYVEHGVLVPVDIDYDEIKEALLDYGDSEVGFANSGYIGKQPIGTFQTMKRIRKAIEGGDDA